MNNYSLKLFLRLVFLILNKTPKIVIGAKIIIKCFRLIKNPVSFLRKKETTIKDNTQYAANIDKIYIIFT